jgi:hypothetical protein
MHVSPLRVRRAALGVAAVCACGAPAVLATGAGASGTVAAHRSLVLVRRDPAVIRGTGFRSHQRVRVTLAAATTYVRRPLANQHGTFTVTFPAAVDRCTAWSVTAVQPGLAAVVIRGAKPECAPASTP